MLPENPSEKNVPQKNGKRNQIVAGVLFFFALLGLLAALIWWEVFRNHETTEDAYVGGNIVIVNSRREGSVIAYYADDADFVKEGQLLVELDPTDCLLNFERKKYALELAASQSTLVDDPLIEQAKIDMRQAYLDLKRCSILAPVSGYVAKRNVQAGQFIKTTSPLLAIISLEDIWIDANFKETQLEDIRIGQPVEVTADMYGGDVIFKGKVGGIQGGSGSVFSLLPPQNASGNWIKIVQRVPVRIYLDAQQIKEHPLFLGLSVFVKVFTADTNGPVFAKEKPLKAVMKTDVFEIPLDSLNLMMKEIIEVNLGAIPDKKIREPRKRQLQK